MPARVVYIVETDDSVRKSLARLVDSAGLESAPCESVDAFLGATPGPQAACAVVDISGLRQCVPAVWSRLRAVAVAVPVIALSAQDDPAMHRMARDLGAAAFFHKPVDGAALLDSIDWVTRAEGTHPAG